ncbi:MAG: hypothetical protein WCB58_13690 [Acidobacteriaceae bacterium]|jgi:hypothetical protein
MLRSLFLLLLLGAGTASFARATELKISSAALQRTLVMQLFAADNGRHYLRGNASSACYAYAESPAVTFAGERIQVHLDIRARLGTSLHGRCIGVSLTRAVDVSMLPDADGEIIGFHDVRIEKLSGSRELDLLLMPFLSHIVPSKMQVNAADQIRRLLVNSSDRIGYDVSLDNLQLRSMQVTEDLLVVDVDGGVTVR